MPAMLDDPARPTIYRRSGVQPYPGPDDPLPPHIVPRKVTLRDRITLATLVPFSSPSQVPPSLLAYLCDQFNREIEKGDTYPMIDPVPLADFGPYWFGNFGAAMLIGEIEHVDEVREGRDWSKECLGSFYVKPNYPGRSSHVCNGGFLVTDAARNRGVGRLMGEGYLEWAPMLGYTYSVFNLVYETNVASCRIWDALGFKKIGRVKGCGNLKSHPDELIDAIIYGRDLGPDGEDFVSEERFDKIKFYLKHGKYPNGADRAEKSRLRSAATHYKLLEDDRLMLKDKEVISDPQKQYEIARAVHEQQHAGINKTTATIAEKYHWVRIKETVGLVIRNCTDCKELAKSLGGRGAGDSATPRKQSNADNPEQMNFGPAGRTFAATGPEDEARDAHGEEDGEREEQREGPSHQGPRTDAPSMDAPMPRGLPQNVSRQEPEQQQPHHPFEQPFQQTHGRPSMIHPEMHQYHPAGPSPAQSQAGNLHHQQQPQATFSGLHQLPDYTDMPLDPRIMEDVQHHLASYHHTDGDSPHPPAPSPGHAILPSHLSPTHSYHHQPQLSHTHPDSHAHPHARPSSHTDYQALLEGDGPPHPALHRAQHQQSRLHYSSSLTSAAPPGSSHYPTLPHPPQLEHLHGYPHHTPPTEHGTHANGGLLSDNSPGVMAEAAYGGQDGHAGTVLGGDPVHVGVDMNNDLHGRLMGATAANVAMRGASQKPMAVGLDDIGDIDVDVNNVDVALGADIGVGAGAVGHGFALGQGPGPPRADMAPGDLGIPISMPVTTVSMTVPVSGPGSR